MRNLIIYGTKYGCTAECANKLAASLEGQTDVLNVEQNATIDVSVYDRIIIGSSVYMGQINKKLKKFIEEHLAKLLGKETVIFICCSLPDNFNDVLAANFPEQLLANTMEKTFVGGRLDIDKMKLVDRTIAKLMSKQKGDVAPGAGILYDVIEDLAKRLNEHSKGA